MGLQLFKEMKNLCTLRCRGGWRRIRFEPSPRMLITDFSIAVGPFFGSSTTVEGVKITIWSYGEKTELFSHCLEEAVGMVVGIREYLEVSFPREKIDIVLLPQEFRIGSNGFGIAFAYVDQMTYSHLVSTTAEKIRVTQAVYELLLRQWLGSAANTHSSYSKFLAEGLIGYMKLDLLRLIHPELESFLKSSFVADVITLAVYCDTNGNCDGTSLPHHSGVTASKEIFRMRAAAVINMMANIISPSIFRKVVSSFVPRRASTMLVLQSFLQLLTDEARAQGTKDWCDQPLKFGTFLYRWINLRGLPILRLMRDNAAEVMFISHRQIYNKEDRPPVLHVPLVTNGYRRDDSIETTNFSLIWVSPPENSSCSADIAQNSKGQLLDTDGNSYVIVNYDTEIMNEILANIRSNHSQFSASGLRKLTLDHRLRITVDFGDNSLLGDLITVLKLQSTVLPIVTDAGCVEDARNFFRLLLSIDVPYQTLQVLVKKLIGKKYASMDWESHKNLNDNMLRSSLFQLAIEYEILDSVQRAKDIVSSAMRSCRDVDILSCTLDGKPAIHPDIRGSALYGAVKSNDELVYNHIKMIWEKQLAERTLSRSQSVEITQALTASPDHRKAKSLILNLTSDASLSLAEYSEYIQWSDPNVAHNVLDIMKDKNSQPLYAPHVRLALQRIAKYPTQARLKKLQEIIEDAEECKKNWFLIIRCRWLRGTIQEIATRLALVTSIATRIDEYIRHFLENDVNE